MDAGSRLRIAWVADTFDGEKSGGVVSALRFVAALRERHEVTVVAGGPPGPGRAALPRFTVPGFGRVMREMGFAFAWPSGKVLAEAFRDADVVHLQFPFALGVRSIGVARRAGVPVVAAFHVQPENMLLNVGLRSPALTEWTYRLFLRSFFGRADAVVAPTAFARDELVRRGLSVPVEVVSNGIAPSFTPGPDERDPRHRGKLLVLAVGRLAREKRLDVVIEGVRRARGAHRIQLVVTGRGPEERRVRAMAATLPVPAEVGFLSDEELARQLRSADLLVHASEAELEGMAVLEAMGSGTPTLVADGPGSAAARLAVSPDFVFRSGDPGDLARRLDALLEDPARLAAARARCAELAAERGLDRSVRQLEGLYRRLARARPKARALALTGLPRPAGRR